MPVIGFSHYNLRGDRPTLDALRDFYVDVIGLRLGERPPFAHFGYWLYIGEHAVLHLSEARPNEAREANVKGTFDHVAFSCTARHEFEVRLQERGIAFRQAHVPLTGTHQFFLSDPAGNGVELNFGDDRAAARDMQETLHLLETPANSDRLRQSIAEFGAGETLIKDLAQDVAAAEKKQSGSAK